jgi:hypothetical protein
MEIMEENRWFLFFGFKRVRTGDGRPEKVAVFSRQFQYTVFSGQYIQCPVVMTNLTIIQNELRKSLGYKK